MEPVTKTCHLCNRLLPVASFYVQGDRQMAGCKDCRKTRRKKDRKLRREVYRAHVAVGDAIRDGRLLRPDACSACAKEGGRIEAHHEDYTKALAVIWLCSRCHRKRHLGELLPKDLLRP